MATLQHSGRREEVERDVDVRQVGPEVVRVADRVEVPRRLAEHLLVALLIVAIPRRGPAERRHEFAQHVGDEEHEDAQDQKYIEDFYDEDPEQNDQND